MAFTEWHREKWRVKWKKPDGKYTSASFDDAGEPFADEEAARQYGRDQEALIRAGKWTDPHAPKITFKEWADTWYAGLDLEPTTLRNYRSLLQGHLIPVFKDRSLESFVIEEMAAWERSIVRAGYAPRTAQDARSLLINILGDAVPRHIPFNPALRRRGKGRKGLRRIEAHKRAAKVWPSPLDVILIAERAALLAGNPDVFAMLVTKAWTGIRWSELMALTPDALLPDGRLDIRVKLYELSNFYWSHPKDGSIRALHLPPFLLAMLQEVARRARSCTCTGRDAELPRIDGEEVVEWCTGQACLFLTPQRAHYVRGGFAGRVMRPAADGFYPAKTGARAREARRVLADVAVYGEAPARGRPPVVAGEVAWPGAPVYMPWPEAVKGQEFEPPRGRGRPDWASWPEGERPHLVTWLPIRPGLTPHGLRHGHQTWMDDGGIKKALKIDRMGHEDLTMSGIYGHVTEKMVTELLDLLQALWENGVAERFKIWPCSSVPVLDAAMAPWREGTADGAVTLLRRQA